MVNKADKNEARLRRHKRVRGKISGTTETPRLNVYRSSANIYAQIIDDTKGVTLCAASTLDKEFTGIGSNKVRNLLLNSVKIAEGLGRTYHNSRHPDGMDCHTGGWRNKRLFCTDCQRNANGMPSAQNQGNGGFLHPGDHFRNGKTCFDIAAHRIEQKQ